MQHSEDLISIAILFDRGYETHVYPEDGKKLAEKLLTVARYIEQLEAGVDEHRRARQRQLEMRVAAEQRAARLAEFARR